MTLRDRMQPERVAEEYTSWGHKALMARDNWTYTLPLELGYRATGFGLHGPVCPTPELAVTYWQRERWRYLETCTETCPMCGRQGLSREKPKAPCADCGVTCRWVGLRKAGGKQLQWIWESV